ncbi:MAG: tRNA (adenosine(37)-N6)-threonylcarbamoyltransferase complex dimerization subunit type 1 TsaB [Anaerolineaceae bacterium]|nr:tRNA (adenosine(37)-N6)-threonylcarbamoyltransferase complex dimerization subunit type 1 TsaB [Anaerolineaceae bacterium]NTV36471.1 tRNA (adenosine(37)-N6)-threonylcarbamoyltransferase complex dimerization subunit type 1 TsaB [Anaerolineaceae bacterium]
MLLAVDASTQWMGLALYDGAQVLAETIWRTRNHHTVELAPALDTLIRRNGFTPNQLKAAAVALGPGSFTSLRIGLAVVKGLALSQKLPVIGIPTLDILAAGQPIKDIPMIAVLQAGRGRLAIVNYLSNGKEWVAQGDPQVSTAEELSHQIKGPTLICGELSADERQMLGRKYKNVILASPAQCVRRPAILAELAWKRLLAGKTDDVISLSPIYLHVAEEIPG